MITSGIDANRANHVFINCPFTDDFRPLFQCAIFKAGLVRLSELAGLPPQPDRPDKKSGPDREHKKRPSGKLA